MTLVCHLACRHARARRRTWAHGQRPAALQRQEQLLLGHHVEEVSRGSVLSIGEAEVEASIQGS